MSEIVRTEFWRRGRHVTAWRSAVSGRFVAAPPWHTCSIKYNFDRWKLDCSCTGRGTHEEISARLKNFMIKKGFKSDWWFGDCLAFNVIMVCIECEEAVDELKVEECICLGRPPS